MQEGPQQRLASSLQDQLQELKRVLLPVLTVIRQPLQVQCSCCLTAPLKHHRLE
jgi:hypothetical protein